MKKPSLIIFTTLFLVAIILTQGPFFDTSTKAGLGDTLSEWIGSKVIVKLYIPKAYTGSAIKLNGVTLLAVSDYGIVVERGVSEKIFVNERVIGSITLK